MLYICINRSCCSIYTNARSRKRKHIINAYIYFNNKLFEILSMYVSKCVYKTEIKLN